MELIRYLRLIMIPVLFFTTDRTITQEKQSVPKLSTVADTVELTSLAQWPTPTQQVPPVYPARAQQDNVEAEVMLSVLIGKDGKPKNIKVVNVKTSFMKESPVKSGVSVPDPKYAKLFRKPSIDAVMKWRFTNPLKPDSTAAFVWVNVPLKYQLKF